MNKKLPEFFKDKTKVAILIFGLLVIGELIWANTYLSRPTALPVEPAPTPTPTPKASLLLSPAEGSFKMGETFEVEIKLEAADDISTDGVDVILTFDKEKLEVQGGKLTKGSLYLQEIINSVDNKEGKIKFSALNPVGIGARIKGGGTIATITFKAIKEGTAKVSFDFTPGSAKDSNVAAHAAGADILTRVVDGEYTIEE